MNVLPAILPSLIERLVTAYKPEKIILFGSHAQGSSNMDSDIDLCVVKKDARSHRTKMAELLKLMRGFGVALDIIPLQPEELVDPPPHKAIQREISRTGITVYEQE